MPTEKKIILPWITEETAPFWNAARENKLLLQRCCDCGAFRHPPSPICPKCNSFAADWVEACGRGQVYSYTIVHHPVHAAVNEKVPYSIAIIELEEGPQVISSVVGCALSEVRVGMPVRVVFLDVAQETTLAYFQPVE